MNSISLKINKKSSWQRQEAISNKGLAYNNQTSWQKQLAVGKNISVKQIIKPYHKSFDEQLASSWQFYHIFLPTANCKIAPSQIYSQIRAVGKKLQKSLKKKQLASLRSHYLQYFDP